MSFLLTFSSLASPVTSGLYGFRASQKSHTLSLCTYVDENYLWIFWCFQIKVVALQSVNGIKAFEA